MLGLNLKFKNCLIQSKLRIQRHIIARVDSSAISSPNLEEIDCPKHSSTFSCLQTIVCERHCATSNFAADLMLVAQWRAFGAQNYLYIVTFKSRLKAGLGCRAVTMATVVLQRVRHFGCHLGKWKVKLEFCPKLVFFTSNFNLHY